MRLSVLFLLSFVRAAFASPPTYTTLRGGGGVSPEIASQSLAVLTVANGAYMAVAPEQAGTKLYKLSKGECTPTVKRLIMNNGMSALSLATTSSLLAFTDAKPPMAVAAGLISRLCVLLYDMVGEPVDMSVNGLVPGYLLQIACAASLVTGKWIDSNIAMKIMAGFYISAGIGISIGPKLLAKLMLKLDAEAVEQRCLLAQAKTDLINGVLCWALVSGEYTRALGMSCVAWVAATLWSDFIVPGFIRSDSVAQLVIATLSGYILLFSADDAGKSARTTAGAATM